MKLNSLGDNAKFRPTVTREVGRTHGDDIHLKRLTRTRVQLNQPYSNIHFLQLKCNLRSIPKEWRKKDKDKDNHNHNPHRIQQLHKLPTERQEW